MLNGNFLVNAYNNMITLLISRYAKTYFRKHPPPYAHPEYNTPQKKSKSNFKDVHSVQMFDSLAIVKCCYQLLVSDTIFFKELWDWSEFVTTHFKYTNKSDLHQIYCNHIIAMLTNMTPIQLNELNANVCPEEIIAFNKDKLQILPVKKLNPFTKKDDLITLNLSNGIVTNVEGVLLPIFNKENHKFYEKTDGNYDKIVKVDSTKINCRSIALGVCSGKAVCLSGPVGCGKTTLVEYLARKTGRINPKQVEVENQKEREEPRKILDIPTEDDFNTLDNTLNTDGFLRIQLGDQTDSKMLLGQYRCTDVPGEFIWLPGVLTQVDITSNFYKKLTFLIRLYF